MSENIPPQQQLFYPDQHSAQQAPRGPDHMGATTHPLSGPHPMLPGIQEGFAHVAPVGYHSRNHPGPLDGQFRTFSQNVTNLYQNQPCANYPPLPNAGHQAPPRDVPFATILNTPLPADNDNDFPPAHKLLEMVARPSGKVAGARRPLPGKGKQGTMEPPAASRGGKGKRKAASPLGCADGKKQRGRTTGAHNYSSEDLDALFDILEGCLPLGGNAWNSASDEFNAWAEENGCPSRTAKSLELLTLTR